MFSSTPHDNEENVSMSWHHHGRAPLVQHSLHDSLSHTRLPICMQNVALLRCHGVDSERGWGDIYWNLMALTCNIYVLSMSDNSYW